MRGEHTAQRHRARNLKAASWEEKNEKRRKYILTHRHTPAYIIRNEKKQRFCIWIHTRERKRNKTTHLLIISSALGKMQISIVCFLFFLELFHLFYHVKGTHTHTQTLIHKNYFPPSCSSIGDGGVITPLLTCMCLPFTIFLVPLAPTKVR